VIHRDLKPGNVMLTRDGAKVLDFGLAKGQEVLTAGVGTDSPTVTQPLTTAGALVGTLLYMAPEQVEGKGADARSDVWALGAMLYQMVTGTKPFTGGSHANVMAAILTAAPRPVSELQPSTPARLQWLIERCLEKSPERRWQSARDLALELGSVAEVSESERQGESGGRRRRWIAPAVGVAAGLVAGLGIGLLAFGAKGGGGADERQVWTTTLLDSTDPRRATFGNFTFTGDGRSVIVEKLEAGEARTFRRSLDSLQTLPVPAGLQQPWKLSPDGRLIAIVDARQTLRTMPSEGGEPGPALAQRAHIVGAWGEDGYIYYWGDDPASSASTAGGPWRPNTWRVRVAGGQPELVGAGFPSDLLPGGQTLLTGVINDQPDFWGAVTAVDLKTGASRMLTPGTSGTYLDPGFLVFCRNGALWAAPIDRSAGEFVAPARSFEEVATSPRPYDFCRFDLSRSGNLAYEARRETGLSRLVWVARDGTVAPVADEVKAFNAAIPSPDGRQVSVAVNVGTGFEQWNLDLASRAWSRPEQSGSTGPLTWVPPGSREFLFVSDRVEGRLQVFLQRADRSAPPERLWPSEQAQLHLDVSADGRQVILVDIGSPKGFVVLDRPSGKVHTMVEDGTVYSATFHPDGDWIVFARIDASRESNLWLVPYPGPGEPRQVTTDGGEEPRWSIDGDEIYYRGRTRVMSIPVEKPDGALVTGRPQPLFEDRFRRNLVRGIQNYRPHPNGRLLMIESMDSEQSLVLVENWGAKVAQAFARDSGG
jgi:serine/threonine-protein kinase